MNGAVSIDPAAILNVSGTPPALNGPAYVIINNDGADAISGPIFGNCGNGAVVSMASPNNGHIYFSGPNAGAGGNDVVLRPNQQPMSVSAGGPYTFDPGPAATHPLTGTATDPDGDALTFTWTYNNPAPITLADANPLFPDEAAGTYTVTLTVSDGLNGIVTTDTTVTIELGAPIADDASFITDEDTPLNQVLTAHSDDPLTYFIVANGTKGVAVITDTATGAFIYTPNANEFGNDSFTFKANNGSDSNVATISIAINSINDAPSFTKGADQTVLDDASAQTVDGWATEISADRPTKARRV